MKRCYKHIIEFSICHPEPPIGVEGKLRRRICRSCTDSSLAFRMTSRMYKREYAVYILGNVSRTVLYVGFTGNLGARLWQHRNDMVKGFTQKYQVHDLLYYEIFEDPENAILREKQIKGWTRKRKEELITKFNPGQKDLYEQVHE